MTCLLVTSIFPPINGGSAVVYEKLCRYMPSESVIVLAPKKHCATNESLNGWEDHDKTCPYPVYRLNLLRPLVVNSRSIFESLYLSLFKDWPLKIKLLVYVSYLVRKHKIKTICIGELHSLSWLGQTIKKLFGVKVINYIHGEEVTTQASYRGFEKNKRKYLNMADGLIAVSDFTKSYLKSHFNIPENKIHLIPNGVDLSQFQPGEKPNFLAERHQLHGKKILLTVGRLIPRKGIDRTIEALPEVIKSVPDIHYIIAGIGPYESELKKRVTQLSLDKYVTFAGRVPTDELCAYYQLCDIFLMPNRTMPDGDTEGFGLVFLEANACGKPVIGGDAGGAVEAVIDNYNGLSIDGNNTQAISKAITRILSSDDLRHQLTTSGLEYANRSDFKHCAASFAAICNQLATSKNDK